MAISLQTSTGQPIVFDITQQELLQPLVSEKRETFSYSFGNAELVRIMFSGIYIVYGDMLLKEKIHFFTFDEPELVEMHFSITGSGRMENLTTGKQHTFKKRHHNMLYVPSFEGTGQFPPNEHCQFFEIHFATKRFLELASNSSPLLMRFAEKVASKQAAELAPDNLLYTFAMQSCINDIMECKFAGGLKLLFLESKCIELLTLQAQAFEEADRKTENGISRQDKDRIYHAREYLLQHSNNPPSLTELAKVAGINEFKLKRGFKEIFNSTVFNYLNDHRMEQAKDLLHQRDKSISEISYELGYSSIHHFSTAFKKKYGIPPSKFCR